MNADLLYVRLTARRDEWLKKALNTKSEQAWLMVLGFNRRITQVLCKGN